MYKRIKDLREDHVLTQKEVADMLHIHQTTYSDYELGKLNIPLEMLTSLANLFQTSTDYLLDRTDERLPYPKNKVGNRNDSGMKM